MQLERYVIEIEHFGIFNLESENIFYALDTLKNELSPDLEFTVLSAFVIKKNDFLINITDYFVCK